MAPALNPLYCGPLLNMTAAELAANEAVAAQASSYTMNVVRYKTPGLVVHARTVEDVLRTVDFARRTNVRLAVRNTGHAYNGQSSAEGGVVLDVSAFADIRVDAETQTLTCSGGSTWGPVYTAANKAGFVVVGGHDPTVGVVGCMVGACHGEFSRLYGYTADNVVEMQVVLPGTEEAQVVTVNSRTNPEQFWAMRGGGPGFGIVLSLTMQMHPAPAAIYMLAPQAAESSTTPLCPGLSAAVAAGRPEQWWSEQGAEILRRVVFNASWWASLPEEWSIYGTPCTSEILYTGENLTEGLRAPAILALTELMGPGSSVTVFQKFASQVDFHVETADANNYLYNTFTSFVPSEAEMGDLPEVVAGLNADGVSATIGFIGMLGGRAMRLGGNAVGDVLRRAVGPEVTMAATMAANLPSTGLILDSLDDLDLLHFELLQKVVNKVQPVVRGKYVNEWVSKDGLARPTVDNFWDSDTYAELLRLKQKTDPCNVLSVEVGVAGDLPHCRAGQRQSGREIFV